MPSASFRIDFDDEALATNVERALTPEFPDKLPKVRASLSRDGAVVSIGLDADDASALRAAVNAYLQLVETAEALAGIGRREP